MPVSLASDPYDEYESHEGGVVSDFGIQDILSNDLAIWSEGEIEATDDNPSEEASRVNRASQGAHESSSESAIHVDSNGTSTSGTDEIYSQRREPSRIGKGAPP